MNRNSIHAVREYKATDETNIYPLLSDIWHSKFCTIFLRQTHVKTCFLVFVCLFDNQMRAVWATSHLLTAWMEGEPAATSAKIQKGPAGWVPRLTQQGPGLAQRDGGRARGQS